MLKNIFKFIFLSIIKFYQIFISSLFPNSCRFSPTCSEYGFQAINKYGPVKGFLLTFKRILRCNSFNSKHGHDPVP